MFVARLNAELVDTADLDRRRVLERARELGLFAVPAPRRFRPWLRRRGSACE